MTETIPNATRGRSRITGVIDQKALSTYSPLLIKNLSLWLDASQITGLSDTDKITTWEDLSGYGNNAVQTTEDRKPVYKATIINLLPVARFAAYPFTEILGLVLGNDVTMTFVHKPTSVTHAGLFDSAAGQANTFRNYPQAGKWEWHNSQPEFLCNAPAGAQIISFITTLNPSRVVDYYINGSLASQNTNASTTAMTWLNPKIGAINGGEACYEGDVAEVILIDRAISDSELADLHFYLNNKYDIW
jgi:hypothetical protein